MYNKSEFLRNQRVRVYFKTWCQVWDSVIEVDHNVKNEPARELSKPQLWPEWKQRFERYRIPTKLNKEND